MMSVELLLFAVCAMLSVVGCRPSGVPEPIKVLENPTTGQRTRFFREIPSKVPAGYSESKHLQEWTATQTQAGFSQEIAVDDDRESLAELRKKTVRRPRSKPTARRPALTGRDSEQIAYGNEEAK